MKQQSNSYHFLPYITPFFMQSITYKHTYYTHIISRHDAIHLQTGFKPPMEVE